MSNKRKVVAVEAEGGKQCFYFFPGNSFGPFSKGMCVNFEATEERIHYKRRGYLIKNVQVEDESTVKNRPKGNALEGRYYSVRSKKGELAHFMSTEDIRNIPIDVSNTDGLLVNNWYHFDTFSRAGKMGIANIKYSAKNYKSENMVMSSKITSAAKQLFVEEEGFLITVGEVAHTDITMADIYKAKDSRGADWGSLNTDRLCEMMEDKLSLKEDSIKGRWEFVAIHWCTINKQAEMPSDFTVYGEWLVNGEVFNPATQQDADRLEKRRAEIIKNLEPSEASLARALWQQLEELRVWQANMKAAKEQKKAVHFLFNAGIMGGGLVRTIVNRCAANTGNNVFKAGQLFVLVAELDGNCRPENFIAINPILQRLAMGEDLDRLKEIVIPKPPLSAYFKDQNKAKGFERNTRCAFLVYDKSAEDEKQVKVRYLGDVDCLTANPTARAYPVGVFVQYRNIDEQYAKYCFRRMEEDKKGLVVRATTLGPRTKGLTTAIAMMDEEVSEQVVAQTRVFARELMQGFGGVFLAMAVHDFYDVSTGNVSNFVIQANSKNVERHSTKSCGGGRRTQ